MKALQSERTWIAGGLGAAAVLVAGAWFFAISPQLSHANDVRSQQSDAQAQNGVLQAKVNKLHKESENLPVLTGELAARLLALPVDASYSQLTDQLHTQAGQTHVALTQITIGGPAPATVSVPGTAVASAVAGGTYQIPVTLTSSGPLAAQLKFLDAIEHTGPRVALVSTAQFGTGTGGSADSIDPGASMTTKLTVFVTPLNQAAAQQLKSELETSPSS